MRRSTKVTLGIVGLTLAGCLWWLLADDPVRKYSSDIEDYAPSTPEGVANYERLYLLCNSIPDCPTISGADHALDYDRSDTAKLLAFEGENREALAEEFASLEPHFTELAAIVGNGPIGSDMDTFSDPVISFAGIRTLIRAASLEAELSIAKSSDPPNIKKLLTMYQLGAQWYPNSRTYVHRMILVVVQKTALSSLLQLLPQLNTEQLLQVRDLLRQDKTQYASGMFTAIWTDYCMFAAALDDPELTSDPNFDNVLLLPNATLNDYGEAIAQIQANYKSGDPDFDQAFEQLWLENERIHPRNLRNLPGRMLLSMVMPGVSKTISEAALVDERRDELLRAIEERLAADESPAK